MLNATYEQWLVESIVQSKLRREVSPNEKTYRTVPCGCHAFCPLRLHLAAGKDTTSEQTTADASSNSTPPPTPTTAPKPPRPPARPLPSAFPASTSSSSLPLWYIHEQGWDVENGFNLELTVFAQGSGINEALGSGLVDVFTIGAAGISSCSVYDASTSIPMRTPAPARTLSSAPTATSRRVKGELADYPEVYGSADTPERQEFLLPMGTAAQILADVYLQQFGLTEDDVTLVNMNDDSAYQAFVSRRSRSRQDLLPHH